MGKYEIGGADGDQEKLIVEGATEIGGAAGVSILTT
jgi:hypothetical protein